MGSGTSKSSTKIEQAKEIVDNSKEDIIVDRSWNLMNVHSTSAIGGAMVTICIILLLGSIVCLYYYLRWRARTRANARIAPAPAPEPAAPPPVIVQSPGYQNQLIQHTRHPVPYQGPEFLRMMELINRERVIQNALASKAGSW